MFCAQLLVPMLVRPVKAPPANVATPFDHELLNVTELFMPIVVPLSVIEELPIELALVNFGMVFVVPPPAWDTLAVPGEE